MTVIIHPAPASSLSAADYEAWRGIPVAVAVDLGRDIGQIDPAIRPLNPPGQQKPLFGRAVTALCEPPDFGAVIHALDYCGPGDVLVIAAGGVSQFAMIGEILGGHLRQRGCVGLVCDGAVRDVDMMASWSDFSVFSRFITPRGPQSAERGAVNAPVIVGGQLVQPGDLIMGDGDGLIALNPAHIKARLADAQSKVKKEEVWISDLAAGRSPLETFGLQPGRKI